MPTMQTSLLVGTVLLSVNGGFTTTTRTGSTDYCPAEYFNVSCSAGRVLLMQSAQYGRMAPGRCVGFGYGHIGCSVNVLTYMHARCTARTRCVVYVADPSLHKMNPCPRDLTAYLRAKYACVPVATSSQHQCRLHGVTRLTDNHGYISSSAGGGYCPWVITVDAGQTVRLTTLALDSTSGKTGGLRRKIGSVREETGSEVEMEACGGRECIVHTSISNVVRVTLSSLVIASLPPFLLEYEAVGCASLTAPPGVTVVSDGRTAVVTCNYTLETWNLVCSGTKWIGDLGNCTRNGGIRTWSKPVVYAEGESFPYGILLVVAAGVTLGVVLGGLLLSLAAFYMRREQREPCSGVADGGLSDDNYQQRAYTRDGVTRAVLFTSRPYDTHERVASLPDHSLLYRKSEQKILSAQSESSIYHGDSSLKSGHVYESPQFT